MKRSIVVTKDGSTSIRIDDWNENYHSSNGAIQEAKHVFIKHGFHEFMDFDFVSILEIGFGTGLNAFVTFLDKNEMQTIDYTGVDAYPISNEEFTSLNFVQELNAVSKKNIFDEMFKSEWDKKIPLEPNFFLTKRKQFFQEITDKNKFHLIYFDAFGYPVQPELWSDSIFKKMYDALLPNGVLVTYACRTVIKNAMLNAGFSIEKLKGAPGKREMLRARKNIPNII